jgi:hypothetical protein
MTDIITMTRIMEIPSLTLQGEDIHLPHLPVHVGVHINEVNDVEAFHLVCFSERTLLALMLYDFRRMSWEEANERALGETIMDNRLDFPVVRVCWGTSAVRYFLISERLLRGPRVGSGMTPFHYQLSWLS